MGYMSSAGWDSSTGEWYQAQDVNGNMLIHRWDNAGSWVSAMTLTGAGHGNQIAVERTWSGLFIWVMWETKDSGGTVTGRSVRRVQYTPTARTLSQTQQIGFGLGATTYAAPALDQENDRVCIRMTTGGQDTFKVYKLSDIMQGIIVQQGVTVQMGSTDATTYQGHAIGGDGIYRITNIPHLGRESNTQADWDDGTHVANNVDQWNWRTGAKVATRDFRRAAQFSTDADQFRLEPEGLDVVPVEGKPVLIGNWKVGSGDIGTYNEQRARLMTLTPRT